MQTVLKQWQTKAIKFVKRGVSGDAPFTAPELTPALRGFIADNLRDAYTISEVKAIFARAAEHPDLQRNARTACNAPVTQPTEHNIAGQWITHNGQEIYIENGVIEYGPAHLVGQEITDEMA